MDKKILFFTIILFCGLLSAQGLIPPIVGGNITINQNITIIGGGNGTGKAGGTPYLFNTSDTIFLNEIKLNDTIGKYTSNLTGGGGGGNPFDQSLNTTDNVNFNNVTSTSWFNGLFNWVIGTVDKYIIANFDGNTLDISINETALNDTIGKYTSNLTGGGGGGNLSWNESRANELYAGIEWDYNQSLATFDMWNSTWDNKGYIDNQDIFYNTSIAEYVDNQIAGLLLGNNSWNQSLADTLYASIEWGYNQSLTTFSLYNSTWDNRALIDAIVQDNSSWNQTLADTLYAGIEWDYNQTIGTFNQYNSTWDNRGEIYWDLNEEDIINKDNRNVNITQNLSIGIAVIFEEGGDLIFR